MYPAYGWMDSYPHHTNPVHYAPVGDRRRLEIPSPMKMDPNTLNLPYQPQPYGGNHYYTVPHEYHSCCNHGCFSCPYSLRPPYPHYPPPPPPYGFYPPFPATFSGYSIPPPHYSIEQPRYDYDKFSHAHGLCDGCKHREGDKKLSTEQEEPKLDKKTNNPLVPLLLKDYPYPIMWVPPGYMDTQSKAKEEEKRVDDPVSLKLLEPSKNGGDSEETTQDQLGEDRNRFPFPIFWLPYRNDEVGKDLKDNDHNLAAQKESPSFRGGDDKKLTKKTDEGLGSDTQSEMSGKSAVQKVIPVKQLGADVEKKSMTDSKAKSSSLDKKDNSVEGKHSPRSSKLPPVCLRIDPLPQKKKSSRSPSPPADKGRTKGSVADDSKSSHQQTQLSEGLKKGKDEQPKGNIKTIEVTNDANKAENDRLADLHDIVLRKQEIKDQDEGKEKETTQDPADDSKSSQQQTQLSEGLEKRKDQTEGNIKTIMVANDSNKVENDSVSENKQKNLEIKDHGEGSESQKEMMLDQLGDEKSCIVEKRNLSEDEAALIIQSVYRGYQVRKSQPLSKLRQIAVVGKQVVELRNRILDLESSSSNIHVDDKQKLIIGETIMSLLLKLDTIQGLHPIVRDVRKSVARELVGLQEKLDSLKSLKPEAVRSEDDTADQAQVQSDESVEHLNSGLGLHENSEAEPTSVCDQKKEDFNQLQVSTDQPENHTDSIHEENVMNPDSKFQETSDQVQVECGTDSVHEENVINPDGKIQETSDQVQVECGTDSVHEENVMNPDGKIQETSDQVQVERGTDFETLESDVRKHNGVEAAQHHEEELPVTTEEAPKVDDGVMEDIGSTGGGKGLMAEVEDMDSSDVAAEEAGGGGDRQKLLEENERLRVAVKELVKAGKEQGRVVKELTGRVKDLEKKLSVSKKKKIKVKKSRSPPTSVRAG